MKKNILFIIGFLISMFLIPTISYGYSTNNIQKKVKLEKVISKYFDKKENKYLKKGVYKKEIYKKILGKIEKINNKIDKIIILNKNISKKTRRTLLDIKAILKVKENEYTFKYQRLSNEIKGKIKIVTNFTDEYIIGNEEKRITKGHYYIYNDFYFNYIKKNFLLNTNLDIEGKNIVIHNNQKPIITEYNYKKNLIKIIGKGENVKIITDNEGIKQKVNNFMKSKNMYELIYSVLNEKNGNKIKIKEMYSTMQEEENIKKILDNNKINENKLCQLLNNTFKINSYKCISGIDKENIQVSIGKTGKSSTYDFMLPRLKVLIKLNYHNGRLTETNIIYGNKNLLTINKYGISSNFRIDNYPFSINTNIKNNFGTIKIRFANAIANIKITNKYAILELIENKINSDTNNLKIILKYKDEYSLQAFINNNNEHIKINGKYYPEYKKIVVSVVSQLGVWKRMDMLTIQQINKFNYNLEYFRDGNYENNKRKIKVNSNIKMKFIK